MKPISRAPSLDRVAIGLSGLCAVHCAVTPIAVVLFPVLSACAGSDWMFHALLLTLVLPSSLIALGLGCRRHRDVRVLVLGLAGLGLLVFTVGLGHEAWERPLTLTATALMVVAHLRNYRLCRFDDCQHRGGSR